MDAETLKRIKRIETKAAELREKIRELEIALENVYEEDEEFAGYLDAYQSYYTDEPLSIRRYYELSEELSRLNEQFMKCPPEHYEARWREHRDRVQYLERVLAA